MLKNYKIENIGPVSYNFRLDKIFKYKKTKLVDIEKGIYPELVEVKLPYIIKPGEYLLGKTIEEFDTPLELASLYGCRSTAFRIGLNIITGINNDPGYKGSATMGIQNVSQSPIKIFHGMELMKTIFVEVKGNTIPIQTRYMGGKII